MSSKRAYFWRGEQFTRILLNKCKETRDQQQRYVFTWLISYQRMKDRYRGPDEYRSIVGPILQDNWKVFSKQFKADSSEVGRVIHVEQIETITVKGSPKDVFAIVVLVPKTDFWTERNQDKIGRLALVDFETTRVKLNNFIYTGCNPRHTIKLFCLREYRRDTKTKSSTMFHPRSSVELRMRLMLSHENQPRRNRPVKIAAKPVKTEYSNTLHFLNRWTQQRMDYPALELVLDSSAVLEFREEFNEIQRNARMYDSYIGRIRARLNEMQV